MMTRPWLLVFFAGCAAGALASTASCSSSSSGGPAQTDAATKPIVIGMSAPLSGDYAAVGAALRDGTKTAEQYINSLGGILGRQVSIKINDDQSDKANVLTGVVQGLLDENVTALLGPASSGQVKATYQMAQQKPIVQISAWATSPLLTTFEPPGSGRWLFRTPPPDDFQGRAMFLVMTQAGGAPDAGAGAALHACQQPYVLYGDDAIGPPIKQLLDTLFGAKGVTPYSQSIPTDPKTTYDPEIDALFAHNPKPDCAAFILYPGTAIAVLNQLKARRQAVTPDPLPANFFIVANDGVKDPTVLVNTRVDKADPNSPCAAEGMVGIVPDTTPQTGEFDDFKREFNLVTGQDQVPDYAANAFDAAVLAMLAIEQAKTATDPVAIRDALFAVSKGGRIFGPANIGEAINAIRSGVDIDYRGASGEVDFDDYGNVMADYINWAVVGGQFVIVRRIKASELKF